MIEVNKEFKIPENDIVGKRTFTNPLGEYGNPDPCIVYCEKENCYYGISTNAAVSYWGEDNLVIHRAKNFEDMFSKSESTLAYKSNDADETYGLLWAPELHYVDGKWYIYTSCQNSNEDKRKHIIVLEAKTDSPFDGFKLCGHINRDIYAIDPSVYKDIENDRLYLCCSTVVDDVQMLAIQELKSPGEPIGEMALIAKPELDWELIPPYDKIPIVEGGYFVKSPGGRLFILYSANGCWSDDYLIGLLEFKGGELTDANAWEKYPEIMLKKGNGNYGPGHATFFYSPDKSELWICHHCLVESNPSYKPAKRRCHCQRVYFDETGFIHIGELAPSGVPFAVPSEK